MKKTGKEMFYLSIYTYKITKAAKRPTIMQGLLEFDTLKDTKTRARRLITNEMAGLKQDLKSLQGRLDAVEKAYSNL